MGLKLISTQVVVTVEVGVELGNIDTVGICLYPFKYYISIIAPTPLKYFKKMLKRNGSYIPISNW